MSLDAAQHMTLMYTSQPPWGLVTIRDRTIPERDTDMEDRASTEGTE